MGSSGISHKERSEGWVWVDRGSIDANPKSLLDSEIGPDGIHLNKSDPHQRNFIDCVLSGNEPITPIETAHRSITIAHLGNISLRLGRDLKWDPEAERITGDDEADGCSPVPCGNPGA